MSNTQTFLALYKELEGLLRDQSHGLTVLKYEEFLSEDEKEKLRICRQIRNYIQHHDDGDEFLICSEKMCDFLKKLINKEVDEDAQHILPLTPIKIKDRLIDIKTMFGKTQRTWLPVVDEKGTYMGTFEMLQLIRILSNKSNTLSLSSVISSDTLSKTNFPILKEKSKSLNEFKGKDAVVIGEDAKYIGVYKY